MNPTSFEISREFDSFYSELHEATMNQGKRHYDILGFEGWDTLLSMTLPKSWWLRIMAVRMLRQLRMVPHQSVLGMLFFPSTPPVLLWTGQARNVTTGGRWRFGPRELPRGDLTFLYKACVWEVRDVAGHVQPYLQAADPLFISTRQ